MISTMNADAPRFREIIGKCRTGNADQGRNGQRLCNFFAYQRETAICVSHGGLSFQIWNAPLDGRLIMTCRTQMSIVRCNALILRMRNGLDKLTSPGWLGFGTVHL